MKQLFVALLLCLVFNSCDNEDDLKGFDQDAFPIEGTWKLTAAYISAGGPQYWTDVENGEEIEFQGNGSFSSDRYPECTSGNFSVDEGNLTLEYDCEGFETGTENEEGLITYTLDYGKNTILLTPTSIICIEGCSYKYEKVD
ncbi:lipocalin family protein [Allomuricauda sp. M10]|uniref:lipocalin family protein n=1 Tax=Allomuricauda sp. M10 TaxID=2683292 RepID=UPI001D184769|nr:lipocalin family protein [Muricauda sp. M10]